MSFTDATGYSSKKVAAACCCLARGLMIFIASSSGTANCATSSVLSPTPLETLVSRVTTSAFTSSRRAAAGEAVPMAWYSADRSMALPWANRASSTCRFRWD